MSKKKKKKNNKPNNSNNKNKNINNKGKANNSDKVAKDVKSGNDNKPKKDHISKDEKQNSVNKKENTSTLKDAQVSEDTAVPAASPAAEEKASKAVSTAETKTKKSSSNESIFKRLCDFVGLKTKTDYIICAVGALIIIALLILAVLLFCGVFQTKESRAATVSYYGRDENDMSVSLITSSEDEQRIMSGEMDLEFDNAKFDFYSLTECEFSDASSILPLSLANPSYNDCVLVFTITNGEGEILFRSLGVRPGYVLTYVSLSRNIPYGENELKMYVTAFKEKEGKDETKYVKIGNSIASLKLTHTAVVETVD